ncbi:hypothetical protein GCM10027284_16010 [Cyclobacterium sediminis]
MEQAGLRQLKVDLIILLDENDYPLVNRDEVNKETLNKQRTLNPKYAIDILLRAEIALKYPIVAVFNFTIAVLC